MLEPRGNPDDLAPGTFVCVRCTNRVYSFATEQPPCAVCGNHEWRRSGSLDPNRTHLGDLRATRTDERAQSYEASSPRAA